MLDVERDDIEAEMQGCCSDQEVFEGDDVALGRLLAFDTASKLCDLQRYRMHDQIVESLLSEDATTFAVCLGSGPVDAVGKFHDAHSRERNIHLPMRRPRLVEDVFDGAATPFACDQNARIQDQAQPINPMPKCRVACGCG